MFSLLWGFYMFQADDMKEKVVAIYRTEKGKKVLEILDIMSYFSSKNIPIKMFVDLVGGTEELESAVELLKQYSVINLLQQNPIMLDISEPTQQVIRTILKEENKEEVTLRKALKLFQIGLESDNLDHAISTWHYANGCQELIEEFYMLPSSIVQKLGDCGRYEEACSFGMEQLKVLRLHDETLLYLQYKIGNVLLKQRKFEEALRIYENKTHVHKDVKVFLRYAAEDGNLEAIKFLIENKGADDDVYYGKSLMHCAVRGNNLEVVRFLVEEKEVDSNLANIWGVTPIQHASEQGNLDIVKFLVEKGADFNSMDNTRRTSVHYAAKQSNPSIIEFFVEGGADFMAHDSDLKTPLHYAAKGGNLDVVKFLVKKGADVNYADRGGKTPLHWAAYMGDLNIVRSLIKKGANVSAIDKNRMTPLDYAFEKFDPMEPIDCIGGTQLHYAVHFGNVELVQNLLKRVKDDQLHDFINQMTKGGNTALSLAVKVNNKNIIKILDQALQEVPYTSIENVSIAGPSCLGLDNLT